MTAPFFGLEKSSSRRIASPSRLLLLLIFTTTTVYAQDIGGSLRGSVADPSGATVANTKITAINTDTDFARSAVSDGKETMSWFLCLWVAAVWKRKLRGSRNIFKTVLLST